MMTKSPFQRVNVDVALELLARPNVVVLDSRDAASYERGRIKSAVRLSSANLEALIGRTPKDSPVLIYCYKGNGSKVHAQTFSDFGFHEVYSLDGGFEAWVKAQAAICSAVPPPELSATLRTWLGEHGYPQCDVNAVADHGITPLMRASQLGQVTVAAELLRAGALIETRNADGNNALWFACVGARRESLSLLIAARIDINNQNDNGATCLMYAASTGKAPIVEQLIAAGADLKRESLDGFTALDSASTAECLKLLREVGHPVAS